MRETNQTAERVWQILTLAVMATIIYLILGGYVRFKKTKPQEAVEVFWDGARDGTNWVNGYPTNFIIRSNVFVGDIRFTNNVFIAYDRTQPPPGYSIACDKEAGKYAPLCEGYFFIDHPIYTNRAEALARLWRVYDIKEKNKEAQKPKINELDNISKFHWEECK